MTLPFSKQRFLVRFLFTVTVLFATTAESVPSVLNRLPLPLLGMPVDKSGKPVLAKVLIYPNEISFVKAGGAKGTAGYYDGWKQAILLRADTFLKPPRQSWH